MLWVGLLLNWSSIVAAVVAVSVMWVVVAGVRSDSLDSACSWSWSISHGLFALSFVAHSFGSLSAVWVGQNSEISTARWLRELVRARSTVALLAWCGAMFVLFVVVKYLDSGSWNGAVYVGVCTTLLGAALGGLVRFGRELRRICRVADWTPLILDGVDAGHVEREVDYVDSAWRSVGADWVSPRSITSTTTALRYATMAGSRSAATHYAGRGLTLLFGTLTVTALVWSVNIELHPVAVAVPIVAALPLMAGFVMERRSAELEELHRDYSAVARALASEYDATFDNAPRQTFWRRIVAGARADLT